MALGIACVPGPNLFRTTAFRLTLLYVLLFTASVAVILGFIYWSTVEVIDRQTTATIEAEIKAAHLPSWLREQAYLLRGAIGMVRERLLAPEDAPGTAPAAPPDATELGTPGRLA